MGLAADIGDWLASQGHVRGATGWAFCDQYRSDRQDQIVVAGQYAGFEPEHKTGIERPGLQILVRSAEHDTDVAEAKIHAIFRDLTDGANWPATVNGSSYRSIQAVQSPFLLEFDEKRRPVWAVNFKVWMSPA